MYSKTKLERVLELHRGYDLPERERKEGNVPIISSSGYSGLHNDCKCDGENVITGRYGTIGEVFYHEGKCWPLNTALYVSDFKENNPKYVYYLLKYILKMSIDGKDKSTVPGVDRNVLHQMEIPFCQDIKEQKELIRILEKLDERIDLNRKINDNLINTTDTIFFKVFLENKPTATISFTDIVQLMGGGTPKTDEDSFWNGNILFFTPKDISRSPFCISTEKHLTNEGLNNCSSRLYPPYTTFVTCRGTVGNLALAGVPMAMNQSCYALKGKNDFPALFVFSFTRYVIATMKKKASGAVFSALVTRDFEMEKVFEPNFEDAILFEKRVEPLFAQILANTNEIQQLLDLQNALLTQLSSR